MVGLTGREQGGEREALLAVSPAPYQGVEVNQGDVVLVPDTGTASSLVGADPMPVASTLTPAIGQPLGSLESATSPEVGWRERRAMWSEAGSASGLTPIPGQVAWGATAQGTCCGKRSQSRFEFGWSW